ncbi:Uncharacterized protein PITC_076890 [Penicillium italicum]|uniref:BTB domain-containing protein n=1 Tax=Penicillium italicum TaxID=40296 RepID=A0A0A2KLV4_PENIT|nr:Uncharacterized protein PITC_076890 [Penicillium italicum]
MAQNSVRSLQADIEKIQGPILTIIVGDSKEPLHVHKSIICNSSPFFKNAMSGSWKESKEHTLELPEDDPKIFAWYSHWLYFAKIPTIVEAVAPEDREANHSKEYHDLVEAYVLGDKLLDTKFQNSVIDAIVEKCSTPDAQDGFQYYPNVDAINRAYNSTTKSATIRNLFVDVYVASAEPEWVTNELPKEFIHSVIQGLIENRDFSSEVKVKASKYYVHPSRN